MTCRLDLRLEKSIGSGDKDSVEHTLRGTEGIV